MIVRPRLPLPGDIHPFSLDPSTGVVRWTRDGFAALGCQGLLDMHGHELVDGRILPLESDAVVDMVVRRLARRLTPANGVSSLRIGAPLVLSAQSEPKPSLVVTRFPDRCVGELQPPSGVETVLVVDVRSGADLSVDRPAVYAAGGVPEYWMVDVAGRTLCRHRLPDQGGYGWVEHRGESDVLTGIGGDIRPFALRDLLLSPA